LQGYKALNGRHAELKARELAEELKGFLDRTPKCGGSELERAARERALAVISILERKNAEGASATQLLLREFISGSRLRPGWRFCCSFLDVVPCVTSGNCQTFRPPASSFV
ncbi:MAG: hypothetical protein ABIH46_13730, partial [Chloroflexota bacterium]